MKKLILTGGGTAGHVTPNLALLPDLKDDFEIVYMGSYDGIEKQLAEDAGLKYVGISTGKLRRYRDFKNLTDPFRVIKGFSEAKHFIKEYKPDVVFSKGGFVGVPVIYAAHACHVPCIIHESDLTPGLANRLSIKKADKICYTFPETKAFLPEEKAVHSGSPIRTELLTGDAEKGKEYCGFEDDKPVILVMGGSQGSLNVNKAVREVLPTLLESFNVIHLTGKGKIDNVLLSTPGYAQFEYIKDELKDLFALSDLVISRAGSNSINELLALRKPNILIPLSLEGSRGDQIDNAKSFMEQGFSLMLSEDDLTPKLLLDSVNKVYEERETYKSVMSTAKVSESIKIITDLIKKTAK